MVVLSHQQESKLQQGFAASGHQDPYQDNLKRFLDFCCINKKARITKQQSNEGSNRCQHQKLDIQVYKVEIVSQCLIYSNQKRNRLAALKSRRIIKEISEQFRLLTECRIQTAKASGDKSLHCEYKSFHIHLRIETLLLQCASLARYIIDGVVTQRLDCRLNSPTEHPRFGVSQYGFKEVEGFNNNSIVETGQAILGQHSRQTVAVGDQLNHFLFGAVSHDAAHATEVENADAQLVDLQFLQQLLWVGTVQQMLDGFSGGILDQLFQPYQGLFASLRGFLLQHTHAPVGKVIQYCILLPIQKRDAILDYHMHINVFVNWEFRAQTDLQNRRGQYPIGCQICRQSQHTIAKAYSAVQLHPKLAYFLHQGGIDERAAGSCSNINICLYFVSICTIFFRGHLKSPINDHLNEPRMLAQHPLIAKPAKQLQSLLTLHSIDRNSNHLQLFGRLHLLHQVFIADELHQFSQRRLSYGCFKQPVQIHFAGCVDQSHAAFGHRRSVTLFADAAAVSVHLQPQLRLHIHIIMQAGEWQQRLQQSGFIRDRLSCSFSRNIM